MITDDIEIANKMIDLMAGRLTGLNADHYKNESEKVRDFVKQRIEGLAKPIKENYLQAAKILLNKEDREQ
jgi:hypothetical protein